MDWNAPENSRGEVNRSGELLRRDFSGEIRLDEHELYRVISCVDNWRASHARPLQHLKMTLKTRALRVDAEAIVAQRLKRLASIVTKLQRNRTMKLSQMQDLGGCRAVVDSVGRLERLHESYAQAASKSRARGPELIEQYDYLNTPKADGYRGVHLVLRFRSDSESMASYNGLRIEIQLRTALQHAWATAVETADTFTGQALKSNVGTPDWKRFFSLMGSVLARLERKPRVPGTPSTQRELIRELRELSRSLQVENVLTSWRGIVSGLKRQDGKVAAFLLVLDPKERHTQVTTFSASELAQSRTAYFDTESRIRGTEQQAVLVWADSVSALKRAYPNYFLDTERFLYRLRQAIRR